MRRALCAQMRMLFSTAVMAAVGLLGCGGREVDDPNDTPTTPITCDYNAGIQYIASVPGTVTALAGFGQTTYAATMSGSDDGATTTSLYRLQSGLVPSLVTSNVDWGQGSLVAIANAVGFSHTLGPAGPSSDVTVETADANGNLTTLDSLDSQTSNFFSLTSDGTALEWFRWPLTTASTPNLPVIAKGNAPGAITKLQVSGVAVRSNFVSDGQHFFAAVSQNGVDVVVAQLDVGGTGGMVLDPTPGDAVQMVGVDAANLYYESSQTSSPTWMLWSVAKSGGAAPVALASVAAGANVVIFKGSAYWFVNATQSNIMTLKLGETYVLDDASVPLQSAQQASGSSSPITAIGVNDCGVLFASSDEAGSSDILQMPLR